MNRRYWMLSAAVATAIAGAGIALAEDVYVSRPQTLILPSPSPVDANNPIAVAKQGDKLTVLEHGGLRNKWLKVQVAAGVGWVYETSISPQKVAALSGGGVASGDASVSLAYRGLEPEAVHFAQGKNLDKKPAEEMVKATKAITPAELAQFDAAGHVGEAAGK